MSCRMLSVMVPVCSGGNGIQMEVREGRLGETIKLSFEI